MAKGGEFERHVCKHLSRYIAGNSEDTIFWRSATSGARATTQGKKGIMNMTQVGDISCVDKRGLWLVENFIVECKHYKNLDMDSFFLRNVGKLTKFWKKLKRQCKKYERLPLLIARQNRFPILLLTTELGYKRLTAYGVNPWAYAIRTYPGTVYILNFEETFQC